MPRDTDVFCVHCQHYMSRSRERAHRALHRQPLLSPPPRLPSKLRRVFDIEPEQASEEVTNPQGEVAGANIEFLQYPLSTEPTAAAAGTSINAIKAIENSIYNGWNLNLNTLHSDSEDGEGSDGPGADEDDDPLDADVFDWDQFDTRAGLSAWDQLGEGYEQDAARISESCQW
jgi:hypothetical protein